MTITIVTDEEGNVFHFKGDDLHRDNGPAVIWLDGTQEWYLNGQLHRDDGPAMTWPDGTQKWYQNDKLHREDGPAVIWPDGHTAWCLHYAEYTFDTWCELTNIAPEQKTLLMLKYQT